MLAKGSLNNIFQDSFDKILSQQLTHDKLYISNFDIEFKQPLGGCLYY